MEPTDVGRDHEYYQDLLGAYALGAVTEEEWRAVAAHAVACEACRAEVARLRAAAQALPLAVEDREPPPALRDRIQAAVLRDLADADRPVAAPRPLPAPRREEERAGVPAPLPGPRFGRRFVTPWAAAALLLAFSLGMLTWNVRLHQALGQQEVVETIALQPAEAAAGAAARLTYLEDRRVMIVSVRNLPPLSPGQVYQLWLLRDDAPVPAGIFAQPTAECAVAADPAEYQAVAITVEPGPWGSPSPSGAPLFRAPLGPV